MVENDNASLREDRDNLEALNEKMIQDLENVKVQLDTELAGNSDLKTQLESSGTKLKRLQQSYDSLVSTQGDSQPLIQERDKAKAKCDLLTEKFKKLLAKCKQQEESIKQNGAAKKDFEAKIETIEAELEAKVAMIDHLEQSNAQMTILIHDLKVSSL